MENITRESYGKGGLHILISILIGPIIVHCLSVRGELVESIHRMSILRGGKIEEFAMILKISHEVAQASGRGSRSRWSG